jgi:hypothetical protein
VNKVSNSIVVYAFSDEGISVSEVVKQPYFCALLSSHANLAYLIMKSTPLFSDSIRSLYEPQRNRLKRITSMLFACAGCLWFFLYLPESIMPFQGHEMFKLKQYQIYVVLMTLWGLDFRREHKRLDFIIRKSKELNKDISHITKEDISDALHLFEIYSLIPGSKGYHIALIINWICCLAGLGLLLFQINLLLQTIL